MERDTEEEEEQSEAKPQEVQVIFHLREGMLKANAKSDRNDRDGHGPLVYVGKYSIRICTSRS